MSSEIRVLHYRDNRSDKIWAIDEKPNADGNHDVWYGRRGNTMTFRPISDSDWFARYQAKLDKGYKPCPDKTIDRNTNLVVSKEPEEVPATLWFWISDQVSDLQILDFLESSLNTMTEQFRQQAETLASLPVFKSLSQGQRTGGAELSEGPLAVLLLFALRRHLREQRPAADLSFDPSEIADDNNELLPDSFEQLFEQFSSEKEYQDMRKACPPSDFRKYAIALGAIEAPIDLIAIQSDTKAAFF